MLAGARTAQVRRHRLRDRLADLGEQCESCAAACADYVDACLDSTALDEARAHVKAASDCMDICRAAARLLARHDGMDSRVLRGALVLCARACTACARLARQQAAGHACARECRRCAFACAALAAGFLWRL